MPKLKLSTDVLKQNVIKALDDPNVVVNNVEDMYVEEATEEIVDPCIVDVDANETLSPSDGILAGSTDLRQGDGSSDAFELVLMRNKAIQLGTGKFGSGTAIAYRRGTFGIAPLGMKVITSADAYIATHMSGPIAEANPSFAGQSAKFSAFVRFESYLNILLQNAFNRPLPYNTLTQANRFAFIYAYTRDLGIVQEVINYYSRIAGWFTQNAKRSYVNLGLANDMLNKNDVINALSALISSVSSFKVIDPDFHSNLQFLCDYHLTKKKAFRTNPVHRRSVVIVSPFKTGTITPTGGDACSISTIVTHTSATTGPMLLRQSFPISDYAEALYTEANVPGLVAALTSLTTAVNAMYERYAPILQMIIQAENKGITKFDTLAKFLYSPTEALQVVEPYYSHIARSLDLAAPIVEMEDNQTPKIFAEALFENSTGVPLDANYSTVGYNFAWVGPNFSARRNKSAELMWRVWTVVTKATTAVKDTSTTHLFYNPFNGIYYTHVTSFGSRSATQSSAMTLTFEAYNLDTALISFAAFAQESPVIAFPTFAKVAGTRNASGYTGLSMPANTALQFPYILYAFDLQNDFINAYYVTLGASDTVGEVGFYVVMPYGLSNEDMMLPLDSEAIKRLAAPYAQKSWPILSAPTPRK